MFGSETLLGKFAFYAVELFILAANYCELPIIMIKKHDKTMNNVTPLRSMAYQVTLDSLSSYA